MASYLRRCVCCPNLISSKGIRSLRRGEVRTDSQRQHDLRKCREHHSGQDKPSQQEMIGQLPSRWFRKILQASQKTTPTFTTTHADTSSNVNTSFNPPSTPSTPENLPTDARGAGNRILILTRYARKPNARAATLNPGQVICINYDNHPPTMTFLRKMPRFMETALQALKKTRMPTTRKMPTPDPSRRNRNDSPRKVFVMTAQSS